MDAFDLRLLSLVFIIQRLCRYLEPTIFRLLKNELNGSSNVWTLLCELRIELSEIEKVDVIRISLVNILL